jgi:hypothetical protein
LPARSHLKSSYSQLHNYRRSLLLGHGQSRHLPSWFNQGFDTADLKDAKSQLEELST